MGIGLAFGSVYMGFLSDTKPIFDITGETRDMAYAMAVSNLDDDGIISSDYAREVKACFNKDQFNIRSTQRFINSKIVDVICLSLNGNNK